VAQDIFDIKNLSLSYEESVVISKLSLAIPKGQVLTVIGENGSGKSTLLNALAGLIRPHEGHITLHGKSILDYSPRHLAQHISSVGQSDIRIADMPVWARIAQGYIPHFGTTFHPGPKELQAIQQLAKQLHLSECLQRTLGQLSGGERRRVHLARALINPLSEILILDEPFANVDIGHQPLIVNALRKRLECGHTIICALQQLHLVLELGGTVLGLKDGKKVVFHKPEEALTENNLNVLFNRKGRLYQSEDHYHGVLFESKLD
jgi:iron complex transport system ATP-binding protein